MTDRTVKRVYSARSHLGLNHALAKNGQRTECGKRCGHYATLPPVPLAQFLESNRSCTICRDRLQEQTESE